VATNPEQTDPPPIDQSIDLKNPALAALLAWLIPGLGHWYQGRRAKSVLFFVCIMGLFVYGVYLGSDTKKYAAADIYPYYTDQKGNVIKELDRPIRLGYGRAVYAYWNSDSVRWHYLCQIGVGLPALPALIQSRLMNDHRKVLWGGFMAPPRPVDMSPSDPNFDQPTEHELNRLLHRRFELAGFFTMVAGLLNILVIYDAFAGPFIARPVTKKKDEEPVESKSESMS
jgi:hypothetical protein